MDTLRLNNTISFYRKKWGMTQEELAKKLGVTNQSVSKWETAQCYPDICLLPTLSEIFEISIDELFGKEPLDHTNGCGLSFGDEDTYHVVVVHGNQVVATEDLNKTIHIELPRHCPDHFKVEVLGNIKCDSGINGDVVAHGNVECRTIEGNVECKGDVIYRLLRGY